MLLMWWWNASLPQVSYTPDTVNRRCLYQQMMEDVWTLFLRHHLPFLQVWQKWQGTADYLVHSTIAMIDDRQLPKAQLPIEKVVNSADGSDQSAEVRVGVKTYLWPVS